MVTEKQCGLHNATGKRIREFYPNLEEYWFDFYGKVALSGEPVRYVNQAKTMEGRWFDVYAFRVGGRDSRKVAVLFNDITQRRASEVALLQIERNLRFVMDSAPQKIITAKPSGDVDYFNPQWTEFTGLSFEQIRDWGWMQFIHPDDVDENIRVWRHSIETGEPFQFEHRFRRADGEYHWHFSRALPMRDEAGRIMMWVGSNTDVHEMKQAEAALQRQAGELSDLHRRKDEFLAMLSHELRSPLAPISNAVQLLGLQRGSESPIQQQARSIIERQLGQLQHLVDDLLEVPLITTGRVQLLREWVDIRYIVECAVETVQPLIQLHHHELSISLPQVPNWMQVDPRRLQQVLVNLLTNAAKYTKDGGQIWLSLRQEGNEVVLQVRDSGFGITPELLPHIFDLFTQAERSLDRSQGGLGIGLCLVQRLVELHGGQVTASSVVGQGSEFVVRLPMMGVAEPPPPPTENAIPSGSSLRILMVDDNIDSAMSLSILLRESGHDVRTAHDGPTALEVAIDYRPDVALLDIGLPGLNGYEVAKWMRQQSIIEKIVLVAMTGYGQESDRQRSQAAGFDHHLVKPVKFSKVLELLASVPQRAT